MKKNKKLLCRISYQKDRDAYTLFLSSDGGETWNESMTSYCRCRKQDSEDDEPMYVHVFLIEELKQAIAIGYTMVL